MKHLTYDHTDADDRLACRAIAAWSDADSDALLRVLAEAIAYDSEDGTVGLSRLVFGLLSICCATVREMGDDPARVARAALLDLSAREE